MCCTQLPENTGRKNSQKIAICTPLHNLLDYIFATKACIYNREKPVKQQYLHHISTYPHDMVNFGPLAAEIGWWV